MQVLVQGRGLLEDPRERKGDEVQPAQADISVLHESATSTHRSTRGDLDLIGNVERSMEVLSGKWKVYLLFFMARGVRRHGRLLECLPGASKKVMTDSLRALERDGIVLRQVFAEVPVRVEYSMTPLGRSMSESLIALSEWGKEHAAEVASAREAASFVLAKESSPRGGGL
jgi:DNA-binding HxlR family transcriptional regulator